MPCLLPRARAWSEVPDRRGLGKDGEAEQGHHFLIPVAQHPNGRMTCSEGKGCCPESSGISFEHRVLTGPLSERKMWEETNHVNAFGILFCLRYQSFFMKYQSKVFWRLTLKSDSSLQPFQLGVGPPDVPSMMTSTPPASKHIGELKIDYSWCTGKQNIRSLINLRRFCWDFKSMLSLLFSVII